MEFFMAHLPMILGIALALSECAAAIVQLAFPDNKGVAGVIAGIIKLIQGIKGPTLPPSA